MFDFLKKRKSKDNSICAPVKGVCVDITKCTDTTFSNKLIGDGFIIKPQENTICSPCDGTVKMIFPTKHAFGVTMQNGEEILVHIGINTVELNGKYFEQLVSVDKEVKKGTPVIRIELDVLKAEGYDTSVIVIKTGCQEMKKMHLGEMVMLGDVISGEMDGDY